MSIATQSASKPESATGVSTQRLLSLDALRGFDMFWILGADHVVRSLNTIHDSEFTRELKDQMEHVPFEGFHFYDLIFPMFVFMAGVALTFSVPKMLEGEGRGATLRRIFIRSILLFTLGVLYMGGVSSGFKNVFFAGVLQRIGIAYFFAALIFCFCRNVRALVSVTAACLIGYWALMTFVPVPSLIPNGNPVGGFFPSVNLDWSHLNAPSCESRKSLAYALDQAFMPGQKFEGTILSTLAAVANALFGVLAGLFVQSRKVGEPEKGVLLIGAGVVSLYLGYVWGMQFPIVKVLWTSSYVLVACGYSAVLLGLFYIIIDVWKLQKWAQPFVWIGMNAITIYLISAVVGFPKLASRFVGGDLAVALGKYADFVRYSVALALMFVVVHFLYRRKLFLRL